MDTVKIDIVACTDKQFVMTTGVMMQSVCVNNLDIEINFHIVIDDDVTNEDKKDLKDIVAPFLGKTIIFYYASEKISLDKFPALSFKIKLTRAAYFRLFLTDILPNSVEKVLYLDGDVIIRHSLLPLWNMDLTNYAVGAVRGSEGDMGHFYRLGYSPELGYFNSGVLLINLKYWRDHNVVNDFKDYIKNHSDSILLHDQDVLNVVFKNRKKQIPAKYNLHHGFLVKNPLFDFEKCKDEVLEAREDPVIIHFTAEKPWDADQRHHHPFSSSFYKYQNQTKWKGETRERRSLILHIRHFISDSIRKLGLKSQESIYDFIEIKPID